MAEELEQSQFEQENIEPTQEQQIEQPEQVNQQEQSQQQPQPPSKASQLYQSLIKEGYNQKNLGTEQDFIKRVSDKANADKLYSALIADGYNEKNLGSKNDFITKLAAPVPQPPKQPRQPWETSPLNPVYAVKKAIEEKKKAEAIMPQPTPTIPTKTTAKVTPKRKQLSENDGNLFQGIEDYSKYVWDRTVETVGRVVSGTVKGLGRMIAMGDDPNIPKEEISKGADELGEKIKKQITSPLTSNLNEKRKQEFDGSFIKSTVASLPGLVLESAVPYGAAFMADAFDGAITNINNTKEGAKLPESIKTIYATCSAAAMGITMELGIDKILGKKTALVTNKLTAETITKLLSESKEPITKQAFDAAFKQTAKEFKNKLLATTEKLGHSAAVGSAFMGTNEALNVMAEKAINKYENEDIFEPTSFGQDVARIIKASAHGAGFGLIMGGVHVPFNKVDNYIKTKVAEAKTPEDIANLKQELITNAQNKNLDENSAQRINNLIDEYTSIHSQIPAEVENKKQVADKIKQSNDLKQQANETLESSKSLHPAFQSEKITEAQSLLRAANDIDNKIIDKPIYKIGDREVDRDTFEKFIKSEDAITRDIELYVEGDNEMSTELEKIGGVSKISYEDAEIPKGTIKTTKENDSKNIAGIPSEIGVGEKLIETKPIEGGGAQEISGGGVLQTPGVEGKVETVEPKVGEVITTEAKVEAPKEEEKPTEEVVGEVKAEVPEQKGEGVGEVEAVKYIPTEKQNEIIEKITGNKDKGLNTRWADWFLGESKEAKSYISHDIATNPELQNAMKSKLYDEWKKQNNSDISFDDFLNSEINLYRGGKEGDRNEIDVEGFNSWELTEEGAKKFSKGEPITKVTKKVKDLYGAVDIVGGEIEVIEPTRLSEDYAKKIFESQEMTDKMFDNLSKEEQKQVITLSKSGKYNKALDLANSLLKSKTELPQQKEAKVEAPKGVGEKMEINPIDSDKGINNKDFQDYNGMFSKNKASSPYLTDLLNDEVNGKRGYQLFYKRRMASIEMMSPEEYLKRVREGQGDTIEGQKRVIFQEQKDRIKAGIEKGDKIDMPSLSYDNKGNFDTQEGRHRATIAKERGEKLIPVIIERGATEKDLMNKAQEIVNEANKDLKTNDINEIIDHAADKFNLHRDAVAYLKDNASELKAELPKQKEVKVEAPKKELKPAEEVVGEAKAEVPEQKEIPSGKPKKKASEMAIINRVDAKRTYSHLNTIDTPTDAYGIAKHWLAGGGKISVESFADEVTGLRRNRGAAKIIIPAEAKTSEFTDPKSKLTVDQAAHDLWESLPESVQENVSTSDIRNSMIDLMRSYSKRIDVATDFISEYDAEAAIEKYYKSLAEEFPDEIAQEQKAIEDWMKSEGEEELKITLSDEYINELKKQYEAETKGIEGITEKPTEGKATGGAKEISATEPIREEKAAGEEVKAETPREAKLTAEKAEPPAPPTVTEKGTIEGGEDVIKGITMADNAKRRAEINMPERQPNPETVEQWRAEAEKKISEGYNINDLIDKMEKGEPTDKVENEISRIFTVTLNAEVKKNPSNENINRYQRLIKAREKSSSEIGKSFRSLQGFSNPYENISDFYVAKKEALKVDDLTEAQKAEVQKDYENVQKARDEYEAKWKEAEAKFAEMQAQNELLRQQKEKGKKYTKEGKRDYAAERQSLKDQLKAEIEKYKNNANKLGIASDGGAENFVISAKMAKIIGQIAKSHVDQVGAKLVEVTQRTFDDVKDLFDGITTKDIHDVIAGKYSERKETKSELIANLRQIQAEAKLLNELDRVLAGEPKTEKARVEKNQKLADLRRQINDVKKNNGLEEYSDEARVKKAEKAAEKNIKDLEEKLNNNDLEIKEAKKINSPKLELLRKKQKELRDEIESKRKEAGLGANTEEARAKKAIEANKRKEEKLKERIANGDFEPETKKQSIYDSPEFKKNNPKLYKELLDSQVKKQEAELEFHKKIVENEMANMGNVDKIKEVLKKARGTLKAIFAGVDNSAVAVQNWFTVVTNPVIGKKAIKNQILDFWSEKRFDRYIAELHNSPDWNMIKESGLRVSEPKSLLESGKEEMFPDRFKAIIKLKGKEYGWIKIGDKKYELFDVLKPFERAFTSLGNSLRIIKFRTEAEKMYEKGITFENNPEEFKKLATRINAMTSASEPNKAFKSDLLNLAIWSPRLMASKLNILGISDLASYFPLVKQGYYRSLGEKGKILSKQQLYAAADLAKFATSVVAGSYLYASARGGQLNTDPYDNNFMDVELPNGKSYNFTGGFSKYISTLFQVARGGKTNKLTGKFEEYKGFKDRGSEVLHFMRGKMPPLSGSTVNLAVGRDYTGKETSISAEAEKYKMPMAVGQIYDQIQKDGYGSLFMDGLPTFLGVTVKDKSIYADTGLFTKEESEKPEIKILIEKNIPIPKLSAREKYKIKRDEAHPDGIMTSEEYEKFTKNVHDYMMDGFSDEEGNDTIGISDLLNTEYDIETYTETDEDEPSSIKTVFGKNLPNEELKKKIDNLKEKAIKKVLDDMELTKKSKIVIKETE